HEEWAALAPDARRRVWFLGGIVRLAEGLDVRHQGRVNDVRILHATGRAFVEAEGDDDLAPEVEASAFKTDMLARALGREIVVREAASLRKEA
ncbi:MAG: hypothetical protein JO199_09115, partial [Candidatus Eremiobacteraeota bacterium]|nr:hypothetical protein [Candidatus Eremiobacteraeota bacterium]